MRMSGPTDQAASLSHLIQSRGENIFYRANPASKDELRNIAVEGIAVIPDQPFSRRNKAGSNDPC